METHCESKFIKDLKDLSVLCSRACYRHSGPNGPEENAHRFFRSAGACPPRSFIAGAMFQRWGWHGEGQALALR